MGSSKWFAAQRPNSVLKAETCRSRFGTQVNSVGHSLLRCYQTDCVFARDTLAYLWSSVLPGLVMAY